MANSVYSLGSFNFVTLSNVNHPAGLPLFPQELLEIVQRSGVDGTGLAGLGMKGRPFMMRSFVDTASNQASTDLYALYCLAVGSGLYTMVWRDLNFYSLYGLKFDILGVETAMSQRVLCPTGGLGSGAWTLTAFWHLIAVAA